MPCHVNKLRAYTPARAFNRSTLRIVESGMVNLTDFLSRDEYARYGGIMCNLPAYSDNEAVISLYHRRLSAM